MPADHNQIVGFLAAGILTNMDNVANLHSWQWFFLIEGIASILVALTAYTLLPDWPHNTRFLSEQEREMAQYRILNSNGGREERDGGIWQGVKEAVKDPFTWFFCLMHFSLTLGQSFKDFLPSVSLIRSMSHLRSLISVCQLDIANFTADWTPIDYEDLPFRPAHHLPSPSATICDCLH